MFKPTIFSTAILLAYLAGNTVAINLRQEDEEVATEDTTMPGTVEMLDEPTPVPEVKNDLLHADVPTMVQEKLDEATIEIPLLPEESESEDESDGECGCPDPCAVPDNLPAGAWIDPVNQQMAESILEDLEPEVIDVALEFDFTPEEIENMNAGILLPALEKALADLEALHPDLKGFLPEVPSNLDDAINEIMGAMGHSSSTDEYGTTTHSIITGNGWIDSYEAYAQLGTLQKVNPVVVFFADEECGADCEAFEDRWNLLRKNNPGIAAFQLDTDVVPKAAEELGVQTVPYFVLYYKDEPRYSGDGSDWASLKSGVVDTIAESKVSASLVTDEVTRIEETHRISEELAGEIASKFGYDIDEEFEKQNPEPPLEAEEASEE